MQVIVVLQEVPSWAESVVPTSFQTHGLLEVIDLAQREDHVSGVTGQRDGPNVVDEHVLKGRIDFSDGHTKYSRRDELRIEACGDAWKIRQPVADMFKIQNHLEFCA